MICPKCGEYLPPDKENYCKECDEYIVKNGND